MPVEIIDLGDPELGKRLLKNAKGDLPIDVWRHYVLYHDPNPSRPGRTLWHPPSVIGYCDEYPPAVDPQKAVDEAYRILVNILFKNLPLGSPEELMRGIWDAQVVLHQALSSRRKRGQPKSMQGHAVRAYVIRKFNPDPNKPLESKVSWSQLANALLNEKGRCPRCHDTQHQSNSPCVKSLMTAVNRLHTAMKHDGIPT